MKKINYATLAAGEFEIAYKKGRGDTYPILKKEINGTLDVVAVNQLDIWVDDEGLLKGLDPTLIIKNDKSPNITDRDIFLVGPLLFASHDGEGETVSLTAGAKLILKQFKPCILGDKPVMVYYNF